MSHYMSRIRGLFPRHLSEILRTWIEKLIPTLRCCAVNTAAGVAATPNPRFRAQNKSYIYLINLTLSLPCDRHFHLEHGRSGGEIGDICHVLRLGSALWRTTFTMCYD